MEKELTLAIAGIPNSGKTTMFNMLTGALHRVGNYPGVTVEKRQGLIRNPTTEARSGKAGKCPFLILIDFL